MSITVGIDVGSAAVKTVAMEVRADAPELLLAQAIVRIRKRDVVDVVAEAYDVVRAAAGVSAPDYVATTGEGEDIPFATGHFYGMTTHARGALFLEPQARAVLDLGALHARAVAMDPRGRVLGYKMTSQCASGSGQFLENISRYLGVSAAEVGPLSLSSERPERVSSICAVLAETDVINMVSRGIATADILRGVHESMAARFAQLLRSLNLPDGGGAAFVSGGLAGDVGLVSAIEAALVERNGGSAPPALRVHPLSIYAGAIGAAIWGGFRHQRLSQAAAAPPAIV